MMLSLALAKGVSEYEFVHEGLPHRLRALMSLELYRPGKVPRVRPVLSPAGVLGAVEAVPQGCRGRRPYLGTDGFLQTALT